MIPPQGGHVCSVFCIVHFKILQRTESMPDKAGNIEWCTIEMLCFYNPSFSNISHNTEKCLVLDHQCCGELGTVCMTILIYHKDKLCCYSCLTKDLETSVDVSGGNLQTFSLEVRFIDQAPKCLDPTLPKMQTPTSFKLHIVWLSYLLLSLITNWPACLQALKLNKWHFQVILEV